VPDKVLPINAGIRWQNGQDALLTGPTPSGMTHPPYPEEFRQDVVRVARNRGPGVTVEQAATDFGVHPMTLWKWIRGADIDHGTRVGVSSQESAELREARRRIKLLEQENEVLRRAAAYLSQAHVSSRNNPLLP
jgi:transposase